MPLVEPCGHRGEILLALSVVLLKVNIHYFCNKKKYKNCMVGAVMIVGLEWPTPGDLSLTLILTIFLLSFPMWVPTKWFDLHEALHCFVFRFAFSVVLLRIDVVVSSFSFALFLGQPFGALHPVSVLTLG